MSIHPRLVAEDAEELGSWPAGFRGSMSVTTLTFYVGWVRTGIGPNWRDSSALVTDWSTLHVASVVGGAVAGVTGGSEQMSDAND